MTQTATVAQEQRTVGTRRGATACTKAQSGEHRPIDRDGEHGIMDAGSTPAGSYSRSRPGTTGTKSGHGKGGVNGMAPPVIPTNCNSTTSYSRFSHNITIRRVLSKVRPALKARGSAQPPRTIPEEVRKSAANTSAAPGAGTAKQAAAPRQPSVTQPKPKPNARAMCAPTWLAVTLRQGAFVVAADCA
jgi:hypothetical protein